MEVLLLESLPARKRHRAPFDPAHKFRTWCKLRKPHVIVVELRVIGLLYASWGPTHGSDPDTFILLAGRAESDDTNRHSSISQDFPNLLLESQQMLRFLDDSCQTLLTLLGGRFVSSLERSKACSKTVTTMRLREGQLRVRRRRSAGLLNCPVSKCARWSAVHLRFPKAFFLTLA